MPLSCHNVGAYPETSSHATCQGTLGHSRPNLSRKIWPQSSKLTEPLWTDPSIKSGTSVRELISTSEKKKKSAGGE